MVGLGVGALVGLCVATVGFDVGFLVGAGVVGEEVGSGVVGAEVGSGVIVGELVGAGVGLSVGAIVVSHFEQQSQAFRKQSATSV